VYAAYPHLPDNHSTHGIEMAKEGVRTGADQLPVLYLIFRTGAGIDAGVGRAYGVRVFDFYKVFSRAFGEEGDGVKGT